MADDDGGPDAGRRRFLKIATCGLGGGLGLAIAAPAIGYLIHPAGRRIVTTSAEPIDVGAVAALPKDGALVRLTVVAPSVRDAWTTANDVALGAAWVKREGDKITALSGACPHLGCAIAFRKGDKPGAGSFGCPCHDSEFTETGDRVSGPAKRGLDPLPITVENGRLKLTWVQFRADTSSREPA
jgi:menaquinol-cytochrome c reductase iron-sulfur subunit